MKIRALFVMLMLMCSHQPLWAVESLETGYFDSIDQNIPPISVSLTTVRLRMTTEEEYGIGDRIWFTFTVENRGSKSITGLKGIARFSDLDGTVISERQLTTNQEIPAAKSVTIKLSSSYDAADPVDKALGSSTAANISTHFLPQVVLYGDGSRYEAPITR